MSSATRISMVLRERLVGLRMERALRSGFDTAIWSYPKSGSTWLRFLLAGYITGSTDLDFESLDAIAGDFEGFLPTSRSQRRNFQHIDPSVPLKSHDLPTNDWFDSAKTIFLVRDPVRILDSARRHLCRNGHVNPSTRELVDELRSRNLFNYAPWTAQVEKALEQSALGRVKILKYEDLVCAPAPSLKACLEVVGVSVNDRELLDNVVRAYSKGALSARETSYRNTEGFVSTSQRELSRDLQEAVFTSMPDVVSELGYLTS